MIKRTIFSFLRRPGSSIDNLIGRFEMEITTMEASLATLKAESEHLK
jgi:hypothetical protein